MSKYKNLYCEKLAIENIHCYFSLANIQIKLLSRLAFQNSKVFDSKIRRFLFIWPILQISWPQRNVSVNKNAGSNQKASFDTFLSADTI